MTLVYRMCDVISSEACAFNNAGRVGLNLFTPNINIFRDPRWGRGQETVGEDPYIGFQYDYAYVTDFQGGHDERYMKVAGNCKHYVAQDLENWNGTDHFHFNAIVSDQDIVETHLPSFQSCIRGASIMCSFNAINGVPTCENQFFIQTIAREEYGFDGFVVSHCGDIRTIQGKYNYTQTPEETVVVALHAGTDLNCVSFYFNYTQLALNNGTIVEADIDQALITNFNILIRLGYFHLPEIEPYRQIQKSAVDTNASKHFTL